MNIYTTTKSIANTPKLIKEVKELPLSGSIFSSFISKGDSIEIHYSQILTQEQVDEIANHINNFIEVNVIEDLADQYYTEAQEGFGVYRKIMADVILSGGLNPSVDESIRLYIGADDKNTMVVSLKDIRCMLKDSLYQYTMRALHAYLDPAIGFSQEKIDEYSSWVEPYCIASMKSQNYTDEVISQAIQGFKLLPKGQM